MEEQTYPKVDVSRDGRTCIIVVETGDGEEDDIEFDPDLIDRLMERLSVAKQQAAAARLKGGR